MANPQPPNPAPAPPSDAELRKALADEQAKSAKLEQEAKGYLDAARSEWQRAEQAQAALRQTVQQGQQPRPQDAFQRLSQEGLALAPEEQNQLLDRGTRERARDEVYRAAQELERRRLADQHQLKTELAWEFFRNQNPTIAADEEGLVGAVSMAQARALKQGRTLDPVGTLALAKDIYNETRGKAKAGEVPFTEGSGTPGGPNVTTTRPPEAIPPSLWEKLYGAKDVVDETDTNWSLDSMTEKYLDDKNLELEKEGFRSSIGQIMGQLEAARARRAATAK